MAEIISLFNGLMSRHTIWLEITVIHFLSLIRLKTTLQLQVRLALELVLALLKWDRSNLRVGAGLRLALERFGEAYFADFYSSLWGDFSSSLLHFQLRGGISKRSRWAT